MSPPYELFYTINDDDPKTNGIKYTGAINIYKTTTLKVAATFEGAWGEVSEFYYVYPGDLIISSNSSGEYDKVFSLNLSCNVPAYQIYTDISGDFEPYTAPIAIYKDTTVTVQVRFGNDIIETKIFTYTFPAVNINITPNNGAYNDIISVTADCNINGYSLYYNINSSGKTLYKAPFEIDNTAELKVTAEYNNEILGQETRNYNINLPFVNVNLPSGIYDEIINVMLTSSNILLWNDIYYTTDGSNPRENGVLYDGAINISKTTTLKAVPKSGNRWGRTLTFDYIISFPEEDTPKAEIDYINEMLIGLISGGTYSFNSGVPVALTDTTYTINESWFGNYVFIMKKAGINKIDSQSQILYIPARPDNANIQGHNETVAGMNDGYISGVDSTREYSTNGTSWADCTGASIAALAPETYYIRVKATSNSFKTEVTIYAETPPQSVSQPNLEESPNLIYTRRN